MPDSLSPAQAAAQISALVDDLASVLATLAPDIQQQVGQLYTTMRAEIAGAQTAQQQIDAMKRFVAALDQLPEVRASLGAHGSLESYQRSPTQAGGALGDWQAELERLRSLSNPSSPAQSSGPDWLGPVGGMIGSVIGGVARAGDAIGRLARSMRPDPADPQLLDQLPAELVAVPLPMAAPYAATDVVSSAEAEPGAEVLPAPVGSDWITETDPVFLPDAAALPAEPTELPAPQPELPSPAPARPPARPSPVPAEPDQPAPQPTKSIERGAAPRPPLTRYPEIEYPAEVGLGTRTSLFVSLLRQSSQPQTMSPTILTIADTGPANKLPQIEVVLRARGFDIEPSDTQLLEIERGDDVDVRFVLIPRALGPQTIRIDFYQEGRRIGTLRQTTSVVERASLTQPLAMPPEQEREPLQFAAAGTVAPDLELCVEVDPDDPTRLYFALHSTIEAVDYHHARMGSVRLQGSPLERMQAVYGELSGLAGALPATPDEIDYQRRRLARIGNQLWEELFSPELKAAYWQFKDRVSTLLITSDEPWIPWEMVKPFDFDQANARIDEPHLCERFVVARWLSGNGPAERLPVRRVRPVVPSTVNLESVQAELAYLQQLGQLRDGLLPESPYDDRNRVIDLFEHGDFSVLHVAAHGSFDARLPDNSSISLSGGPLRPSDIYARFGGARARPLIFINACHGARAEFAFTGLGGWADRLVRQSRVAAFVGAAWEVNDRLALLFTETFYAALLRDRKTIGESFQIARLRIRDEEPSNSTWLAYVLYADPAASVTVVAN